MSVLLLQQTFNGAMKAGLYTGATKALSDGNPFANEYVDVRPYRYVKASLQSQGLARDNPDNKGVELELRLAGYDSMTTGVQGTICTAQTATVGYRSLHLGEGHGERFEYVVPYLNIIRPDGEPAEVEFNGNTVLELRGYP